MKTILPQLSPYLTLSADKHLVTQNENNEVSQLLMRQSETHSPALISKRVLELLGNLGGECHDVVGDKQISQASMAWDLDRIVKFAMPFLNRKIDIFLDSILPKIIELTKTTVNWETRTAAIELFHATVIYVIGKCNELQASTNFTKIFKKLFPEMLRLASDIQQVPRSIFEPLCKQVVHWLATSVKHDKSEVSTLLDALLTGAADKSNATLREHCAVCIAEYFDWHSRHFTKEKLAENPQTIKSLIRKIQSFAIHPDPFKQLASVLCFDKLVKYLRNEQALADLYLMEISVSLLNALRLAEYSLCENSAKHLTEMLSKAIKHYKIVLQAPNERRSGIKSFEEFTDKLFEKTMACEELCRTSAQQLWAAALDPGTSAWLHNKASKLRSEENKKMDSENMLFPLVEHIPYDQAQAATYLKAEKINAEKFSAQVQFVAWLLKNSYLKWSEFSIIFGKSEIKNFTTNIQNFLNLLSCYQDVGAKELRNPIIRLKIIAFSNLLELFMILDSTEIGEFTNGISSEFLFTILLIAATNPQNLDLELCVSEKPLIQRLNNSVQNMIGKLTGMSPPDKKAKFLLAKMQELYANGKMSNPASGKSLLNLPTERLIQVCLGHLSIYKTMFNGREQKYVIIPEKDPLADLFIDQKNTLIKIIEDLVLETSPQNVQKIKILLKYLLHLGVSYEKIEKWLLENFALFQHCGDILFDYIVGCWEDSDIGFLLIKSCEEKKTMLPVLFPILNRLVNLGKLGFLQIFYEAIPNIWKSISTDMDAIVNELKIYQIIIGVARTKCLNDLQSHLGEKLLRHCQDRIIEYLKDNYSVLVKKESLLLAAEVWNLKILKIHSISSQLSPSLRLIQKRYFPIKTSDLEKSSKEAVNFDIILDAFIKIFTINLNWDSLQWLFLILRESVSTYLGKIKPSLSSYICKTVNSGLDIFLGETSSVFQCFSNPEVFLIIL